MKKSISATWVFFKNDFSERVLGCEFTTAKKPNKKTSAKSRWKLLKKQIPDGAKIVAFWQGFSSVMVTNRPKMVS